MSHHVLLLRLLTKADVCLCVPTEGPSEEVSSPSVAGQILLRARTRSAASYVLRYWRGWQNAAVYDALSEGHGPELADSDVGEADLI